MSGAKYLGIDLGTTNSVAVLGDGDRCEPVRLDDAGALLPSVVRIDSRGNVTVGARARRFLDSDPDNTRSEFKRLMGSGRKLAFRAAKVERTPEELSGLVLGALRAAAERTLGHAPTTAVITVPALFELPQTRATSEAAHLAGFERVEHLQEPVASALTAGHTRENDSAPWLVYDLGGGTFDVSLLETREGVLRVVDHDGDNFLGGRDMDARLLDYVLESLSASSGRELRRSDASLTPLLRRLRTACEEAKFELGARRDAVVAFPDPVVLAGGEEIFVDVAIDQKTFAKLVLPLVDKSAEVCARLCERQGIATRSLGRIVLVGGPTVMPILKERLEERLGAPLATDIDPMTAVAEGAARFAAEHRLETRSSSASKSASGATPSKSAPSSDGSRVGAEPVGERVFLQYPSVSGDLYPFVVGRAAPGRLAMVQLARGDDGFTSAEEKVGDDGTFVVQVELVARGASTFRLLARGPSGEAVLLDPSEVTIRHGLSLADPPLARTIGVALVDGHVAVYFERGAPLPSRKTFRLRTSFGVRPGQNATAISIPIVQGEVELAHLCRLVGTIDIRADKLDRELPVGSSVDVVLEIDRGGRLTAMAHLPEHNVTVPGTLNLVSPDAPAPELEARLVELRKKAEQLYPDPTIGDAGRKKLVAVDARLLEAERELEAAKGADPDALEKLRRLLIDVDGSLAEVEALRTWPELEGEALGTTAFAVEWVSSHGTEMERRTLEETLRSLERARAVRNVGEFSKRLRNVLSLGITASMRDRRAVERLFRSASARVGEMRDPHAGRKHIAEGERAVAQGDIAGIREATHALWALLPPDEERRAKAHGSGVER